MIKKLFNVLALLDSEQKQLSLSNIALYVILVKLALTTNVSLPEVGALLLALLNYGHKRHVANAAAQVEAVASNELANKVDTLLSNVESYSKVVDEAKTIIASTKLSNSLGIRR